MKQLAVIFIAFASSLSFSQDSEEVNQPEEKSKLEINGFVRNFTGVLTDTSGDFAILQNMFNLELKKQDDKIGFFANPYIYQYPDKNIDLGLREIYVDFFTKKMDIRVGKQQIVWGQADGVFITDIVSPKNLSLFLLNDFNEIRIGVNAVKLNYYFNDENSIEVVGISDFKPTIAPEMGSIWAVTPSFLAPPTFDYSMSNTSLSLKNSEVFARYSLTKSWIDLQIMGGTAFDDDPVMHVTKQFDTSQNLTGLLIQPQYHRLSLVGGSFNTVIKDFVVRGEGAIYFDKYFQSNNPLQKEAVIAKNYITYLGGIDRTLGTFRLSAQFIQNIITDYEESMEKDEVESLITFMASTTMLREKIRAEFFVYYGINNQDSFSRLRFFYFPYDAVSIETGINIFSGNGGMFGRYQANDLAYLKVKYNF